MCGKATEKRGAEEEVGGCADMQMCGYADEQLSIDSSNIY
jgi:hypothetical protein